LEERVVQRCPVRKFIASPAWIIVTNRPAAGSLFVQEDQAGQYEKPCVLGDNRILLISMFGSFLPSPGG